MATKSSIPRSVWMLGFVSLFMDISSELIHSLLPVFMVAGLALLIAADLVLALAPGLGTAALGIALWGLHMGMTQGLLATMVAAAAPSHLRGTAFGFFNLASGIAMLAASVLAGLLWDRLGASVTFYAGAVFSALALAMLMLRRQE